MFIFFLMFLQFTQLVNNYEVIKIKLLTCNSCCDISEQICSFIKTACTTSSLSATRYGYYHGNLYNKQIIKKFKYYKNNGLTILIINKNAYIKKRTCDRLIFQEILLNINTMRNNDNKNFLKYHKYFNSLSKNIANVTTITKKHNNKDFMCKIPFQSINSILQGYYNIVTLSSIINITTTNFQIKDNCTNDSQIHIQNTTETPTTKILITKTPYSSTLQPITRSVATSQISIIPFLPTLTTYYKPLLISNNGLDDKIFIAIVSSSAVLFSIALCIIFVKKYKKSKRKKHNSNNNTSISNSLPNIYEDSTNYIENKSYFNPEKKQPSSYLEAHELNQQFQGFVLKNISYHKNNNIDNLSYSEKDYIEVIED